MIVKITQGEKMLVDDDFAWLNSSWSLSGNGYATAWLDGCTRYAHHLVMGGAKKGYYIDHINRNRLDNRKENLRYLTPSESRFNDTQKKGNSGHRGVSFDKKNNKWIAFITINRKTQFLGRYNNIEEAINMRLSAVEKLLTVKPQATYEVVE